MSRNFQKSLIVSCLIFMSFVKIFAVTYYVSPTGTGTGTFASPMSFATAIGKTLTGGDSIILRGGMYSFTGKQTISKAGTAAKYLHIVNYASEVPVLDFRSEAYGTAGVSITSNYVHFKGITVQGAGDNGLYVTGSYNYIEFCVFRWNCDSGLQMKTGSDNIIKNCDSYENFDYETGGLSAPNFGGNADGFADKQYTNTGTNHYKGCRSWRNADDGWDHYEKIGNTTYDSCWCYANGPASYDMKSHIRFKTDSASWFVNFASTNYVVKNYGNGNGFKLGGNYTAHNGTLHDCISVLNTVKGFDQNNNAGVMNVYNCTGNLNNPDYGFSNSTYGTLVIKNCATLATKSSNKFACKSVTQSNNSWNTGFTCTSADFLSTDYSVMLNPRQAGGALPEVTFLHLKPTSTMIDKGLNLGYSFYGSAPDLGAFEFGLSTDLEPVIFSENLDAVFIKSQSAIHISNYSGNITMTDMLGRVVTQFNNSNAENTFTVQNIQKGIYILKPTNHLVYFNATKILIN